jgi:CHAD domain-containing protein
MPARRKARKAARRAAVPRALLRGLLGREPAEGVRLVALELLAEAGTAAARLREPADAEALHDFRVAVRRLRSWLRTFAPLVNDTLRKKWRRALRDLAGSTGTARDAEVMRARISAEREALSPAHRPAADWLLQRVAPEPAPGEPDPRGAPAAAFGRLAPHLEAALARYPRTVGARPRGRFGAAAAEALRAQLGALGAALSAVGGPDDVEHAHRARIEGKRLRYLLEPLRAQAPSARDAVVSMKALQDLLGDLHDVHVLAAQLSDAVAEDRTRSVARRSLRAGLAAVDRRLREARDALHARFEREWRGEGERTAVLREQVERVAAEMERAGSRLSARTPAAPPPRDRTPGSRRR